MRRGARTGQAQEEDLKEIVAFPVSQKIVPPWEQGDHVVKFRVKREEGIQEVEGSRRVLQVEREKLKTVGFCWIFTRGT